LISRVFKDLNCKIIRTKNIETKTNQFGYQARLVICMIPEVAQLAAGALAGMTIDFFRFVVLGALHINGHTKNVLANSNILARLLTAR